MAFTTRDNLEDVLQQTVAIETDECGNLWLVLADSTVWAVAATDARFEFFYLHTVGFPTC